MSTFRESERLNELFYKIKMGSSVENAPEDNWLQLYDFQRGLRSDLNLTASDILRSLDLPESLCQYMYSCKSTPSRKPGSLGLRLRTELTRLQSQREELSFIPQDASTLAREIFETKKEVLKKAGVDSIRLSDDGSLIVGTKTHVEIDKVEALFEPFDLLKNLPIKVQLYHDLVVFGSPVCTTARNGYGTSTIILYEGGVIAATARHVVLSDVQYAELNQHSVAEGSDIDDALPQPDPDIIVRALPRPVPPLLRYSVPPPGAALPAFGGCTLTDLHDEYDIAIVHPLSCNAFPVNTFDGFGEYHLDIEKLLNFNYATGTEVVKVGCATGYTVSTQVGDFATRGDSGSLVICPTTSLAIGIVSAFESDLNWVRCVKLQYITEIATLELVL